MNGFVFMAGIAILIIVYLDFIYTSLSTSGSGFLSMRITKGLWRLLLKLAGGNGRRRLLKYAGEASLLILLTVWIVLVWLGNSLIFCADPDSIRDTATQKPAEVLDKVYFVGYTLSTLGYGDFQPAKPPWKLFAVVVSLIGLSVVTVGVSYLIQVLSSVIKKKQLSLFISSIGSTPQNILLNAWNGKDFKRLEKDFVDLPAMILEHSQNHLAYPILHQFHSTLPSESTSLNLTSLDEALTILFMYVPPAHWPDPSAIRPLRRSLTKYLLTLENDFIRLAPSPLPLPDISWLQKNKIPMIPPSDTDYARLEELTKRRKLWQAVMENDGWNWKDLNESEVQHDMDLKEIPYRH